MSTSFSVSAETPLQTRLAACIQRLSLVEARALALRPEVRELIDELGRIYRDLGGMEAVPVSAASRHAPGVRQMGSKRPCAAHNDGRGANVSESRFRPGKDVCRECERRDVRVDANSIRVTVIEGDKCIGRKCPCCTKPIEVGQRIAAVSLHHESCMA